MRRFILPLLSLSLTVMLVITVFGFGIYQLGWDNKWTEKFVYIFPLPAAMAGRHFVTYRDLAQNEKVYAKTAREASIGKREILDKLIDEAVTDDLAKKEGISISRAELAQYHEYLLSRFGIDAAHSGAEIESRLGISEKEFIRLFVRPDLKRQKYVVNLLADSGAKRKAEEARGAITFGLSFDDAVKKYSQDENSKYIVGNIGFFEDHELDPWLAEGIEGLSAGDVSGVIVSPSGYHIVQLASSLTTDGTRQRELRQILIKGPDFEEFLKRQRENYRVYIFGGI